MPTLILAAAAAQPVRGTCIDLADRARAMLDAPGPERDRATRYLKARIAARKRGEADAADATAARARVP